MDEDDNVRPRHNSSGGDLATSDISMKADPDAPGTLPESPEFPSSESANMTVSVIDQSAVVEDESKDRLQVDETDDDDPVSTAQWLLSLGAQPLSVLVPPSPSPGIEESDDDALSDIEDEVPGSTADIGNLYKICQTNFPKGVQVLKYDHSVNESITDGKKATLTVTVPNGQCRRYKSRGNYTKKSDAKGSATAVAIASGALDLLLTGSDARIKGPPKEEGEEIERRGPLAGNLDQARINEMCEIWRLGAVQPIFTPTVGIKEGVGVGYGCAISIYLSRSNHRSWSVDTEYLRKEEAQAAVCTEAVRLGILEYICRGDGLLEPLEEKPDSKEKSSNFAYVGAVGEGKSRLMTQQSFYDALPKPLPSPVGFGPSDTNPVTFVNHLTQRLRGSNVKSKLTFTIDPKLNLHGCLLRLACGNESYSYLVPNAFARRSEAKASVCLLAVSQNVADVIRDYQKRNPLVGPVAGTGNGFVPSKLPEEDQQLGELCLKAITHELKRFRPDASPKFEYPEDPESERFGAVLEVWLSKRERRKYFSSIEHKYRRDAKLECCIIAVRKGVLEFIRFLGRPPPADYVRPPIEGVDIPYEPDAVPRGDTDEPRYPHTVPDRSADRERSPRRRSRSPVSHHDNLDTYSRSFAEHSLYDHSRGVYASTWSEAASREPPSNAYFASGASSPGHYNERYRSAAASPQYVRGRSPYREISSIPYSDGSVTGNRPASDYPYERHRHSASPPPARVYVSEDFRDRVSGRPASYIRDYDGGPPSRLDDNAWAPAAEAYCYPALPRPPTSPAPRSPYDNPYRYYEVGPSRRSPRQVYSYPQHRHYSPERALYRAHPPYERAPPYVERRQPPLPSIPHERRSSGDYGTNEGDYNRRPDWVASPISRDTRRAGYSHDLQRNRSASGGDSSSKILREPERSSLPPTARAPRAASGAKDSSHGKKNGSKAGVTKQTPASTADTSERVASHIPDKAKGVLSRLDRLSCLDREFKANERKWPSPMLDTRTSVTVHSPPNAAPFTRSIPSQDSSNDQGDSNPPTANAVQAQSSQQARVAVPNPRKRKSVEMSGDRSSGNDASKTIVEQLTEMCQMTGRAGPVYHSSSVETGGFRVWITIGRQKFELQTTYANVESGKERLSRQVLTNLKSDVKKRKLNDGNATSSAAITDG